MCNKVLKTKSNLCKSQLRSKIEPLIKMQFALQRVERKNVENSNWKLNTKTIGIQNNKIIYHKNRNLFEIYKQKKFSQK
jgi:hypothetical protein